MLVQDEFQMRSQTVTSIVDKAQREYMRCHLRVEKMPSNLPSDVPTIVKRYCELLLGKLLLLLLLLFFFLMWRSLILLKIWTVHCFVILNKAGLFSFSSIMFLLSFTSQFF